MWSRLISWGAKALGLASSVATGGVPVTWYLVGALALGCVGLYGTMQFRVALWRADVAQAEKATAEARALTAQVQAQLVEVAANRDRLVVDIERQNRAVADLKRSAEAETARAEKRASEALLTAARRRAREVARKGAGPDVMNAWAAEMVRP
jgi:hypothetical protein